MNPITLQQWLFSPTAQSLPRLESRLLLQRIMGYSHAQLITRDQEILSGNQLSELNQLVNRRLNGEPMAYILGEREFYGRTFEVTPAVLIPRPETEHLVEAVLQRLPNLNNLDNGGISVWDLGTGSGIIAITLQLERPDISVFASDVSLESLEIAQRNAKKLGTNSVQFGLGSWFEVDFGNFGHFGNKPLRFDVLVSNPPYIERTDEHLSQGDLRFEPQHALTDFADGLKHIRHLTAHAPEHLKKGGWLMFEHGYNQGQAVREILAENGFENIETLLDLAGLDRITLGQLIE